MIRISSKSATAALAIIFGVGIGHSYAVTIQGGSSTIVDGWQISPDVGVTLEADEVTGGIVIQKTADFTSGGTLGVSFLQVGLAPNLIEFTTEAITNSTGSDWTGFQFSLTGAAMIPSVSDVFVPPVGTGVNYETVSLNSTGTKVTYTGSQLSGATSNWGSVPVSGSNLLFIQADATSAAPFASFALGETPLGVAPVNPVPLPSALWQSILGLLSLGIIRTLRKAITP